MSIFQIFSLLSSGNPSLVPAPSQEVLSTIFMYPTLLQLSDVICQQFYVPDPAPTFRRHVSTILCTRSCSNFQTSYVNNLSEEVTDMQLNRNAISYLQTGRRLY